MPLVKKRKTRKASKVVPCMKVNFVILGSSNCGKTSLVKRFLNDSFTDYYKPTTMDVFEKYYQYRSMNIAVLYRIFDTTGSDDFPGMRKMAIQSGQTFILVYAVNDRQSYENVKTMRCEILEEKDKDMSILLVGNKCDIDEKDRAVSQEEGQILAQSWNCAFLETSAKLSVNTNNIFTETVIEVLKDKCPALETCTGKMYN